MEKIEKLFNDGTDLFHVLDAIEHKAGLFLLQARLDYLYNFISGIKWFANINGIEMKNINKLNEFSVFIQKKLNEKYTNSFGWFGSLYGAYGNEEGFKKFFEHLNEFRQQ